MTAGFDNERYYEEQVGAFVERIVPDAPTVIEFGGKPFGDFHASRVLPGYDPDVKAGIIRDVRAEIGKSTVAMAVHAKDILAAPNGRRPKRRIRGDYGISYDQEVLRMTDEARDKHQIDVSALAITATPAAMSAENAAYVDWYVERVQREFDVVRVLPEIPGYPDIGETAITALTARQPLTEADEGLLIVSPGGGSGKFSVAISEMAHKLLWNVSPNFIKFETFPVFHLEPEHPLNRAFSAATADLGNQLVRLQSGETNYDKDVGNFALLQSLLSHFPQVTPMAEFTQPTDMGVNVIERGIIDPVIVAKACRAEIERRVSRYEREIRSGSEVPETLRMTKELLA